ncbi:hypothetical protein FB565_008617 [Actinoplanes lutulentus]|uniref:Uncharacterized protein n=1 Tax=Actinoplanes lutulentus TaxID=1287878 RepID=A0A327Z388_9ACTN|nr:hypothetical protein [Actinoplanes lutulentus]RAK29742.1 hypothetical protein B0I29_11768 [Actinoplanes lutulentus]
MADAFDIVRGAQRTYACVPVTPIWCGPSNVRVSEL